jgi:hypothetical protein
MKRLMTIGSAVVLLTACVAFAQSQEGGTYSEDFDTEPLAGWEFSCQKQLVEEGTGKCLRVSGAGHALWIAAERAQARDFELAFRHRYKQDKGTGDIIFRGTGEPPQHRYNFLRLEAGQLVLGVRIHTSDQDVSEQVLKNVTFQLTPDVWHDFVITANGSQIDVAVDGTSVLSGTDPNPLPGAPIGLGIIAGSGEVDYDDAQLTVYGSSSATSAATETSQ